MPIVAGYPNGNQQPSFVQIVKDPYLVEQLNLFSQAPIELGSVLKDLAQIGGVCPVVFIAQVQVIGSVGNRQLQLPGLPVQTPRHGIISKVVKGDG